MIATATCSAVGANTISYGAAGAYNRGMSDIVRLERADWPRAVETLAQAFDADPLWSVILPDRSEYERAMPVLWKGVLAYCQRYGQNFTTPDLEGVACWARPGMARATLWRMIRTGFSLARSVMVLSPPSRKRFLDTIKAIDKIHTRLMPEPHWYLWALGVCPDVQGRGIGGRLLGPILVESDAGGVPCYLETETERAVTFYQRYGFEVVHEERELAAGCPLWFMVRRPNAM